MGFASIDYGERPLSTALPAAVAKAVADPSRRAVLDRLAPRGGSSDPDFDLRQLLREGAEVVGVLPLQRADDERPCARGLPAEWAVVVFHGVVLEVLSAEC